MLELKIRFESSWTNSFYEEPGGAPLFTSGSMAVKPLPLMPPQDRPATSVDTRAATDSAAVTRVRR